MRNILIKVTTKDNKIIKTFLETKCGLGVDEIFINFWSFEVLRINKHYFIFSNLKLENILPSMCDIKDIKKIEEYFISWKEDFWCSMIRFLSVNQIKYNLTKEIEFLRIKKDENISKEEFQKRFPEYKLDNN